MTGVKISILGLSLTFFGLFGFLRGSNEFLDTGIAMFGFLLIIFGLFIGNENLFPFPREGIILLCVELWVVLLAILYYL